MLEREHILLFNLNVFYLLFCQPSFNKWPSMKEVRSKQSFLLHDVEYFLNEWIHEIHSLISFEIKNRTFQDKWTKWRRKRTSLKTEKKTTTSSPQSQRISTDEKHFIKMCYSTNRNLFIDNGMFQKWNEFNKRSNWIDEKRMFYRRKLIPNVCFIKQKWYQNP